MNSKFVVQAAAGSNPRPSIFTEVVEGVLCGVEGSYGGMGSNRVSFSYTACKYIFSIEVAAN